MSKMSKMSKWLFLLSFAAGFAASHAQAQYIDFESAALFNPDSTGEPGEFVLELDPAAPFTTDDVMGLFPGNSVYAFQADGVTLTLRRTNNELFSLRTIDIARLFEIDANNVQAVADFPEGDPLTQILELPVTLNTLQTIKLIGFVNVRSVTFSKVVAAEAADADFAMDNLLIDISGTPDEDGDGIADNDDLCEKTLRGMPVDTDGCSATQSPPSGLPAWLLFEAQPKK